MLETFYREYSKIVYGYLLSLCGDPGEAEELTAETFLKAVEHISRYDPRYHPTTWLCAIAKNLYFSECRRRGKHQPLSESKVGVAPSAEALCLQREEAKRIVQSANLLPSEQRQVLYMRLQGNSFRHIGLAMGKTENWARVTYYRAKQKIRKEMEGME